MRRLAGAGLTICLALTATGCGKQSGEQATKVATAWFAAVADEQFGDACKLQIASATASINAKYLRDDPVTGCAEALRAYRTRLSEELIKAVRDGGFEAQTAATKTRVGVFPAAAKYELSVILMTRTNGEWRVASVGIDPDR